MEKKEGWTGRTGLGVEMPGEGIGEKGREVEREDKGFSEKRSLIELVS